VVGEGPRGLFTLTVNLPGTAQRIARDLVTALDMVKRHVTHALGKLSAANPHRGHHAGARQLGLIP